MKKKILFSSVVGLILLTLILPKIMKPEKVLLVGTQINETSYQFTQEIKDKEKIAEFESWFDEIDFSKDIEIQEGYADMVLQIVHHKEGTSTHLVSLWINGNNITVTNGIGADTKGGKITKAQLDELQDIRE